MQNLGRWDSLVLWTLGSLVLGEMEVRAWARLKGRHCTMNDEVSGIRREHWDGIVVSYGTGMRQIRRGGR
jgi:hypothetical protein